MMGQGAQYSDRLIAPWGRRTPYSPGQRWPSRVDMQLAVPEEQVERWVPSASVLDSNGDALDIAVADGSIVGVRGRADDRVNHGRLLMDRPLLLRMRRARVALPGISVGNG